VDKEEEVMMIIWVMISKMTEMILHRCKRDCINQPIR